MIALIPVSRFNVGYEVAFGRPYSQLEGLVLRAISEDVRTIVALQETFRVHPRLLIEAVVTLTQAGWVAVGGFQEPGFLLTAEGEAAVKHGHTPESLGTTARNTQLVMERISGGLLSGKEIHDVTRYELEDVWNDCLRLRAEVADNDLDEGQVQNFIPRKHGEWLRWIGPIDMISKGRHWLPVTVDLDSRNVIGLPDAWVARLGASILERAEHFAAAIEERRTSQRWSSNRSRRDYDNADEIRWTTTFRNEDLLISDQSHTEYLEHVLSVPEGSVLIGSAFLAKERLDQLSDLFAKALERGVNIDLLWGYAAGNGDAATDWLKKFAYDSRQRGAKGVLRFNRSASESHAKLVLWNHGLETEGCVGSLNWLSSISGGSNADRNVSLRVAHQGMVAALCRCGAALWTGAESEALSSTGERWRRLATELEKGFAASTPPVGESQVRLAVDRDHEALLREWLLTTQDRMLITSHRLGPIAEARLASGGNRARGNSLQYSVLYGTSALDMLAFSRLEDEVSRSRGSLVKVAGLHAKILVSDVSCCVTSYNHLSSDPFGTASRARELGVIIDGGNVPDRLWAWGETLSGHP